MKQFTIQFLIALCLIAPPARAQEADPARAQEADPTQGQEAVAADEPRGADEVVNGDELKEIEVAIQSYVAAFNAKDAKKLASLWSPDGVYISRTSGHRVSGRDAMTAEFAAILTAEDAPQLAVATESIEFISPNVALERGAATVRRGDATEETTYNAVYVKRDGQWLVDRVTEDEIEIRPSNYEHLKDLEWLVGEWIDDGDGVTIEVECRWTKNQNFLSRTYTVSTAEGLDSSGLQIIGWDPKNSQIRSWLFDSDGGFVSGEWNRGDDRWVVQSVVTLADGASGSFTSVFRPTPEGDYTWQKINRVIDGRILPNIDEVVVRKK